VDATIVLLTIDGETLETTAEHPFYELEAAPWLAAGETRGRWTEAGDLAIGAAVWQTEEQRGWKILNIFARHSRRNLLFGLRLVILLQSIDPELSIEPVGAQTISWNQQEWFDFQRGIGSPPDWWTEPPDSLAATA
jgi:hypothetical protein